MTSGGITSWSALALALASSAAAAEVEAPDHARDDRIGLVAGLKAGGGLGLGALGATPVFELELGYTLPFELGEPRALQVFVAGQYTMPSTEGDATAPDERLPGDGQMRYAIEQQQAIITVGLLYRVPVPTAALRPYVALGGRAWLIESTIDARAGGEAYGTHTEQDTEWGGYAALGLDWFIGPGAVLVEVQGVYGALDGFVLRDTHLGGLNGAVGYRLLL
ncbi:MAG: hypothetical protein R3F65_00955 [bacterium]